MPAAQLGCSYEIALNVTARPGGKIRLRPSSDRLTVLRRPRQALDLDQTVEVLLAFAPRLPGYVEEWVDVIAQYATVRVPIEGYVGGELAQGSGVSLGDTSSGAE